MSGKGSGRRPTLVSDKEAEDSWNRIFGKGKPQEGDPLQHNALAKMLFNQHECETLIEEAQGNET
jgi:hypothetical protein